MMRKYRKIMKHVLFSVSVIVGLLSSMSVFAGDRETSMNKLVQAGLNREGYDCGAVDGVIGAGTQAQIDAYCEAQGIEYKDTEELLSHLYTGDSEAEKYEIECQDIGEHLTTKYSDFKQKDDYYFKDFYINDDRIFKLGNQLIVDQGELFRILCLHNSVYFDEFSYLVNRKSFERIYGMEWIDSYEERLPVIEKTRDLLADDTSNEHLFKALSASEALYGTVDYASRSFDLVIPDLTDFAEYYGITDEVVGYLIAALTEYTDKYEYFGNALYIYTE